MASPFVPTPLQKSSCFLWLCWNPAKTGLKMLHSNSILQGNKDPPTVICHVFADLSMLGVHKRKYVQKHVFLLYVSYLAYPDPQHSVKKCFLAGLNDGVTSSICSNPSKIVRRFEADPQIGQSFKPPALEARAPSRRGA